VPAIAVRYGSTPRADRTWGILVKATTHIMPINKIAAISAIRNTTPRDG
jgi:hypothetical protein